jgi:phage terminase small subunit
MAALKNGRQELFAQLLAQGKSKTEAYAMAGYERDRHNAARLTTKDHIAQRVAELQRGAAERVQVTVSDLVSAADEIRELAIRDKQYSAAVGAVKEIGVLTGLRVDRREVGKPGDFEHLSDDELAKWIASESAKLIDVPENDV